MIGAVSFSVTNEMLVRGPLALSASKSLSGQCHGHCCVVPATAFQNSIIVRPGMVAEHNPCTAIQILMSEILYLVRRTHRSAGYPACLPRKRGASIRIAAIKLNAHMGGVASEPFRIIMRRTNVDVTLSIEMIRSSGRGEQAVNLTCHWIMGN